MRKAAASRRLMYTDRLQQLLGEGDCSATRRCQIGVMNTVGDMLTTGRCHSTLFSASLK